MEREAFDDVMASLDPPMAVVTAASGGERAGCLVGFHAQCSIDPPRFLVDVSAIRPESAGGGEAGGPGVADVGLR